MEGMEAPKYEQVGFTYDYERGEGRFVIGSGGTAPFYSVEAGMLLLEELNKTGKLSKMNFETLRNELISSYLETSPTWGDVDEGYVELPEDTRMN